MIKIKSTKTFINEDAGVIVFKIYDALGREFIGKSKCSKEDKFDKDFGEKLAYLIFNGYDKDDYLIFS